MYEREIAALENERREIDAAGADGDFYTPAQLRRIQEIEMEILDLRERQEDERAEADAREYRAEWLEQQPTRYSQLGY